MENPPKLSEIITSYGGIELKMNVAGEEQKRYVLCVGQHECRDLFKMDMKTLSYGMRSEEIYSIIFAEKKRGIMEVIIEKNDVLCRLEAYPEEIFKIKRPEDWIRISELLYPENKLPDIYC